MRGRRCQTQSFPKRLIFEVREVVYHPHWRLLCVLLLSVSMLMVMAVVMSVLIDSVDGFVIKGREVFLLLILVDGY